MHNIGTSCKGQLANKFIKFERIRDLEFKNCNYEKREINTYKNFSWEAFPCKIFLCQILESDLV